MYTCICTNICMYVYAQVLMPINPRLKPVFISQKQSATDAYNITVKLLGMESSARVIAIYRAPWLLPADSKALFGNWKSYFKTL